MKKEDRALELVRRTACKCKGCVPTHKFSLSAAMLLDTLAEIYPDPDNVDHNQAMRSAETAISVLATLILPEEKHVEAQALVHLVLDAIELDGANIVTGLVTSEKKEVVRSGGTTILH